MRAIEIFLVLQLLLPPKVVIGPLGQVGSPATLWALLCLLWYLWSVVTGRLPVGRGRQPVRWALLILLSTWSLSYVAMIIRLAPTLEQNGADALLVHLVAWTAICLIAADGLGSFDDVLRVCKVLVALVAAVSVIGMLQFVGFNSVVDLLTSLPGTTVNGALSSVETRGSFNRVAGTMTHPIEFAMRRGPHAAHRRSRSCRGSTRRTGGGGRSRPA